MPQKIKPLLKDNMNNLKKSGTWKFQRNLATNFMSSKDTEETHVMHSKSESQSKNYLDIDI